MRLYLGTLALLFLAALPVRADDHVQCVGERSQCSSQILAACPEGALIMSEREYPAVNAVGESGTGYELTIRCQGHTSDATAAPVLPAVPTLKLPRHDIRQVRAARVRLQADYDRVHVVSAGVASALSLAAVGAVAGLAAYDIAHEDADFGPIVLGGSVLAVGLTVGALTWLVKSVRERHALRRQLRELDGLSVSFARTSESTGAMLSYQTRF
jgi:hypothetical protein